MKDIPQNYQFLWSTEEETENPNKTIKQCKVIRLVTKSFPSK